MWCLLGTWHQGSLFCVCVCVCVFKHFEQVIYSQVSKPTEEYQVKSLLHSARLSAVRVASWWSEVVCSRMQPLMLLSGSVWRRVRQLWKLGRWITSPVSLKNQNYVLGVGVFRILRQALVFFLQFPDGLEQPIFSTSNLLESCIFYKGSIFNLLDFLEGKFWSHK